MPKRKPVVRDEMEEGQPKAAPTSRSAASSFEAMLTKFEELYAPELEVPRVTTKSVQLDQLMGGGLPLGKYLTLHSQEGLGKSTIALCIAKALAEQGYRTVYLDTESGISDRLLTSMSIMEHYRNHMISFLRPQTFGEMENVFTDMIPHPEVSFIVVDSITTILAAQMLEQSIEKAMVGTESRLQTALLKKYKIAAQANKTTILWLNQMRTKINMNSYGGATVEPSGCKALRYMSDISMNMKPVRDITKGSGDNRVVIGRELCIWAEKNRYTAPKVEYPLFLLYGEGLSGLRYIVDLLVQNDIVHFYGAGYHKFTTPDGEQQIIQGSENMVAYVNDHYEWAIEQIKARGLL